MLEKIIAPDVEVRDRARFGGRTGWGAKRLILRVRALLFPLVGRSCTAITTRVIGERPEDVGRAEKSVGHCVDVVGRGHLERQPMCRVVGAGLRLDNPNSVQLAANRFEERERQQLPGNGTGCRA